MGLSITRRLRRDGSVAERRIFIGDRIIITLSAIDVNKVTLTIEAPPEIVIEREENLPPEKRTEIERRARRRER